MQINKNISEELLKTSETTTDAIQVNTSETLYGQKWNQMLNKGKQKVETLWTQNKLLRNQMKFKLKTIVMW